MMTALRRSTSMTLDAALLDEAKSHGINLSRAAEAGILAALKQQRAEAWKRDNAEALAEMNRLVAENGLPLRAIWLEDDPIAQAV
jgi:antitoxin CcdA